MFDSGPEVQCIERNPRLRRGRLRQSAHGPRACLIIFCWMRVLRTMSAEGPAMAHIPESLQVMEPGRRHKDAALAQRGPLGVRTPASPLHSAVHSSWLVRARVTLFRCRRTSVRVRPPWARPGPFRTRRPPWCAPPPASTGKHSAEPRSRQSTTDPVLVRQIQRSSQAAVAAARPIAGQPATGVRAPSPRTLLSSCRVRARLSLIWGRRSSVRVRPSWQRPGPLRARKPCEAAAMKWHRASSVRRPRRREQCWRMLMGSVWSMS